MGLLDDAIREHLELKRRRGGDPAEIARAEQEALGPVRREAAPAVEEPHDEPPLPVDHDAPAVHDEPSHAHVPEQHVAAPADKLPPGADAFEEPAPAPAVPEQHVAAPADRLPPQEEEPPAADPRRSEIVDQPTTEYRVEDHHDDAPPPTGDEDVLEETPDFLQETPEHDRLWFEQRPPRDFDFDD